MWKKTVITTTTLDPGRKYTGTQLAEIADAILREDSRSELCRECGSKGEFSEYVKQMAQFDSIGDPIVDKEGHQLILEFPEITCLSELCGAIWYQGEGVARGIGGDNPILFEEHFQSRRRREIYCTVGTPDPSITQGIYNRTHPRGRKVNSEEQRKRNGASFFR